MCDEICVCYVVIRIKVSSRSPWRLSYHATCSSPICLPLCSLEWRNRDFQRNYLALQQVSNNSWIMRPWLDGKDRNIIGNSFKLYLPVFTANKYISFEILTQWMVPTNVDISVTAHGKYSSRDDDSSSSKPQTFFFLVLWPPMTELETEIKQVISVSLRFSKAI